MPTWYKLTDSIMKQFYSGKMYNPQMLHDFAKENKLNQASFAWPKDYAKLLMDGHYPHCYRYIKRNIPPYLDHTAIYKSAETGLMCLTYQPYKGAVENPSEIEKWASANGLVAEIYDPEYSWYYPGATCLVVIHLPEAVISIDSLKPQKDLQ